MSDDSDDDSRFKPRAWNTFLDETGPRGLPVMDSEEITRVLAIPRRPSVTEGSPTADALVEIMMERLSLGPRACDCRKIDENRFLGGKDGCIHTLTWIQSWALYEMGIANGLLGNISVGSGKSMLFLEAPLAMKNCELALLLIPPSLVDQIQVDWRLANEHFRVPNLIVHISGRRSVSYDARVRADGKREPTLHVLPFSKISSIDSSDYIDKLRPDLIICDEVDAFRSVVSSRTLRLSRYLEEHHETTRFVAGTGSLTDTSPSEWAHLSYWALRDNSPVPRDKEIADDWSRCLGAVPNPCPAGALQRLLNPGEDEDQIRHAFRRRLADTMGFILVAGKQVITTAAGEEVKLIVRERVVDAIPAIVEEALEKVRDGIRPDTMGGSEFDEIIADPMEQIACAKQVATGMFYRWIFPRGEPRPLRLAWYEARKLWNSELRARMLVGAQQLDSPKLCERAARRAWGDDPPGHLRDCNVDRCPGCAPEWKAEHWPRWREIMNQVQPETEAVRLHPFLVEDAANWALSEPGIVWYGMTEFAEWLSEISGLTIFGGGTEAGRRIVLERGDRSIIASMKAHGRGRDRLQYAFWRQLVANMFSSARISQQLLARLHRRNQSHTEVISEIYLHTPELKKSLDQVLRRAEYVRDTTGELQKFLESWQGDRDDGPDDGDPSLE